MANTKTVNKVKLKLKDSGMWISEDTAIFGDEIVEVNPDKLSYVTKEKILTAVQKNIIDMDLKVAKKWHTEIRQARKELLSSQKEENSKLADYTIKVGPGSDAIWKSPARTNDETGKQGHEINIIDNENPKPYFEISIKDPEFALVYSALKQGKLRIIETKNDVDLKITEIEENLHNKDPETKEEKKASLMQKAANKIDLPYQKLMDAIIRIDDGDLLEAMLVVEKRQKKRKTVVSTIKNKLSEMGYNTNIIADEEVEYDAAKDKQKKDIKVSELEYDDEPEYIKGATGEARKQMSKNTLDKIRNKAKKKG